MTIHYRQTITKNHNFSGNVASVKVWSPKKSFTGFQNLFFLGQFILVSLLSETSVHLWLEVFFFKTYLKELGSGGKAQVVRHGSWMLWDQRQKTKDGKPFWLLQWFGKSIGALHFYRSFIFTNDQYWAWSNKWPWEFSWIQKWIYCPPWYGILLFWCSVLASS